MLPPLRPKSVKMAYEVIGQPPALRGYSHLSVASKSVLDMRVGAWTADGATQALRVVTSLAWPSPLKLVAET